MRDIWATPPGGGDVAVTKDRSYVKAFVAGGLVLLLGLGVGGVLRWMGASTPVSAETALEEFRATRSSGQTAEAEDDGKATSKSAGKTRQKPTDRARPAGTVKSNTAAAGGASSQGGGQTGGSQATGSRPPQKEPAARPGRPEEGVYTWEIDGYERAPGTRREMPERSHRVITWEGTNDWTEHHIFSEQREQWFHLEFSDEGVAATAVRNKVVIGPITEDKTIVYDPPMFVGIFPFKLGQTWEGSWEGKTSGEYKARTFEHTTLTIGGEEVEVWATEVQMTMQGEIDGSSLVRSWVAPEYKLVVKQYQETTVTSGPGEYYNEWTGKLLSLRPRQ